MNAFQDILPALWRKRLYALFFLTGVVFGAIQVWGGVDWIGRALNVYAYVGVGMGWVAASNTNSADEAVPVAIVDPPADEGRIDPELVAVIAAGVAIGLLVGLLIT